MLALSVRQPFAEQIARGTKTIEYRTWKTVYRGPLLICASAVPHVDAAPGACDGLPMGCTVCVVDLVNITGTDGDYSWLLLRPRRVAKIPVRGYAALYNVPDEKIFPLVPDCQQRSAQPTRDP